MRQVARRLRDGRLELVEAPPPALTPRNLLVEVDASVISPGTERATLEVARKGLLAKARARPDQARQVLERARREGLRSTFALVRQRLEELGPLGYSAAGRVLEAGPLAGGFAVGDRVAVAGAGFANHAEVDSVPALLAARVPDGVDQRDAAFANIGAIALHGFRRGGAHVGSRVAVVGLGLIGQLAVRVSRAAGCRVLGIDLERPLLDLAAGAGVEVALRSELGEAWEGWADAVLICATTGESDPVELAATLARDKGPVVVVGDVRLDLPRARFYEKELDLRLSRSAGPGRYDPGYELRGADYPIGQVRWTEQRNMEAFLALVAEGALRPAELVTHSFAIDEAERAFDVLLRERPVAIVLDYRAEAAGGDGAAASGPAPAAAAKPQARPAAARATRERPRFGIVGAGNFATSTVIPGLLAAGFEPAVVVSAQGLSAADAQRRFGFAAAAGGVESVVEAEDLDLVVIATRHDSHAALAARALAAGLPVYVEKPLALDLQGVRDVQAAQRATGAPLVVGFNRRHSAFARELRGLSGPRVMSYRVNAGRVESGHWMNDPERGGGRLKGEGCHFVDFLCDQAGCDPLAVSASGYRSDDELPLVATDNFAVEISFADGSVGTLSYAADAPTGPGKERFEVSAAGSYGVIEDFRRAFLWEARGRSRVGRGGRDKGFAAQFEWLAAVARGSEPPPDPDGFLVSTLATLAAARSLEIGERVPVIGAGAKPS